MADWFRPVPVMKSKLAVAVEVACINAE